MIYGFHDRSPQIADSVFIADSADVIGKVSIGKDSSVWFGCLIRGDVDEISIGERTNIQDLSLIHVTGGKYPTIIGNDVTFGHRVTVHGARLKDHSFLGIGSTVMDDCEIGEFAMLAAGSLLPPGKVVPDGMLAMGSPAKVIRPISETERAMILEIPKKYALLAAQYLDKSKVAPIK
ncbi:MAG: gamma carbonic anhydrase family protein [Leptonema sp. (in: Bacteria)]|nr:gamma carbonic anhydrase family protein [Leptonema sp. (in: bacteria)]